MSSTVVRDPAPPVESPAEPRRVRLRTALAVITWVLSAVLVAAAVLAVPKARDSRKFEAMASGLRTELATQTSRLGAAQASLASIRQQLDAARQQRADLAASVETNSKTLKSLAAKIKKLEAERDAAKAAEAAAAAAAAAARQQSSGSQFIAPPGPVQLPSPPTPICTFDPVSGMLVCKFG